MESLEILKKEKEKQVENCDKRVKMELDSKNPSKADIDQILKEFPGLENSEKERIRNEAYKEIEKREKQEEDKSEKTKAQEAKDNPGSLSELESLQKSLPLIGRLVEHEITIKKGSSTEGTINEGAQSEPSTEEESES